MEVHHHPIAIGSHPSPGSGHRKKWTHYFWEFLMLFLAVFCGFLAENFREHMIEHNREKQYMITMLEDLRSDTAFVNNIVGALKEPNNSIDSVADAIQFPMMNTNFNKVYRHLFKAFDYYSFQYNVRTISQLKSSGNFRLIRNKEVANMIIAYDRFNTNEGVNIEAQRNSFFERAIDSRNKIFDQSILRHLYVQYGNKAVMVSENKVIDSLIQKNKNPLSLASLNILLYEFKNALLTYRMSYKDLNWCYKGILKRANQLMLLIKKEYHLK